MLHQPVHEEPAPGAVETGESFGFTRSLARLQCASAYNEITLPSAAAGDGRLEFEVWSVNQRGQMTAAVWASAAIR